MSFLVTAFRAAMDALACRRGAIGVMFALLAIPIGVTTGLAVDFAIAQMSARHAQGAVDAAALAGARVFQDASAQSQAILAAQQMLASRMADLTGGGSMSASSVTANAGSGTCRDALNTVTVSATITVPTTLMSLVVPSIQTTMTAKAGYNGAAVTIASESFDFSRTAANYNALYWYKVPASGGVPSTSELNFIADNARNKTYPSSYTICLPPGTRIGIMLSSTLSTFHSDPTTDNVYGGIGGRAYRYYSHLWPPSIVDYPLSAVTTNPYGGAGSPSNNVLQITSSNTYGTYKTMQPGRTFPVSGAKPYDAAVADGTLTCNDTTSGNDYTYYWNDLGRGDIPPSYPDDLNYTDVVVRVRCIAAYGDLTASLLQ